MSTPLVTHSGKSLLLLFFVFFLFYKSLNNYREVSYHDFNLHFSNN